MIGKFNAKRFLADWLANYVFFVPLVVVINRGWNWPSDVLIGYLLWSIVISCVGGRAFSYFLKYWYRLWKEEF